MSIIATAIGALGGAVGGARLATVIVAEGPDEQYLYLSDILPTAWQAVVYADPPREGTLVVLGLGPVGQFSARIAKHFGVARVIGVDSVPERRAAAEGFGVETFDPSDIGNVATTLIDLVDGRGPDAVIDAVGMEAHGQDRPTSNKIADVAQKLTGLLPDAVAAKLVDKAGIDRIDALLTAMKAVRRGGTLSIIGVYGGEADPLPMMELFDRGVQIRMGQAHVKRWIDDLVPVITDPADPLGIHTFATHHLPLEQAPHGYEIFRDKSDGCIKVVLHP